MSYGTIRTHIILSNRINAQRPAYDTKASTSSITKADGVVAEPTLKKESPTSRFERLSMPFIPSHDIPRGILHAGQAALEFSFMLVVMCVSSLHSSFPSFAHLPLKDLSTRFHHFHCCRSRSWRDALWSLQYPCTPVLAVAVLSVVISVVTDLYIVRAV